MYYINSGKIKAKRKMIVGLLHEKTNNAVADSEGAQGLRSNATSHPPVFKYPMKLK